MQSLYKAGSSRALKDLIMIAIVAEAFFIALFPMAAEIALVIGFLL